MRSTSLYAVAGAVLATALLSQGCRTLNRSRDRVTADMVKPGAVVVDVGVNRVPDASKKAGYRLVGDVDYAGVAPVASLITPVPGGVGPMTIAMLMRNTLKAARRRLPA